MGNKQQLQLNNETLASILSNVLGLPSQESLKQGAYVWAKSLKEIVPLTVKNPSCTFTNWTGGREYKISSSNFDVTQVDITFFDGFELEFTEVNNNTTTMKYENGVMNVYINGSLDCTATYDAANTLMKFSSALLILKSGSYIGTKTISGQTTEQTTFLGYVVSDDSTAYPDGGEKDGYWYEKVNGFEALLDISEYTKISIDKFTLSTSSYNTDISHSLGEIPKLAMIFTDSRNNVTKNGSILSAMVIYPIDESGQISGSYNGIYSDIYSNAPNYHYSSSFSVSSSSKYPSDTIIKWYTGSSSTLLQSGVEYTLITMA